MVGCHELLIDGELPDVAGRRESSTDSQVGQRGRPEQAPVAGAPVFEKPEILAASVKAFARLDL
jgi:hypothetical protein